MMRGAVALMWRRMLLSLGEEMHDRANFAAEVGGQLFSIGISALFFAIIYQHVPSVAGWKYEEALLVLGLYELVSALTGFVLRKNLRRLPRLVRYGQLDLQLTQPVDMQLNLIRHFDFHYLGALIGSLVILSYAFSALNVSVLASLAYAFAFASLGFAFTWSVIFGLNTLGFWLIRNDNLGHLADAILGLAHVPVDAYGLGIATGFRLILPLAIIGTIPAEVILGKADWVSVIASTGIVIVLFVVSRGFFFWALRSYNSASG